MGDTDFRISLSSDNSAIIALDQPELIVHGSEQSVHTLSPYGDSRMITRRG
jgi:hypothetical protein